MQCSCACETTSLSFDGDAGETSTRVRCAGMSQTSPPPPDSDPPIPAPPPPTPPPGYYASGETPSSGWAGPLGAYSAPAVWRGLQGLTTALTVMFAVAIAIAALGIIGVVHHLSVLSDEPEVAGRLLDADRVNDAATFPGVMLILFVLLSIAIFVVFVIWLFRAAKNNEALGRANPRFGPGWAIGAWFIPLANLVIPVMIVWDLWKGSDASVPRGDPNWRRARGGAIVIAWWIAYLVMTVPRGFTGLGKDDEGRFSKASDVRRSDMLEIVAAVGAIAAGALAIVMVRQLTARQEECLRVQQSATPVAPPPAS